ncbi:uracil-DNA glycosylase [Methanolobus halotolerans]|uniref:Type-4 uracil-DNA glycosylase n=1 Tax=Methanolobus halotolerans TaxID=2052935 RepID=A0A4E0Q7H5_9EURY|nr:uracil-DNA glycosylase [Methanolobus halotolerans]
MIDGGFEHLEKEIRKCANCSLHEGATNPVIMKGSRDPNILFIGEAPGKTEDMTGIPFSGRAGKKLDEMIGYMGLSPDDYAVINVLKCRPPNNRKPRKSEIEQCKPFLMAQIRFLDPRVIILLGNTAEEAFFSRKEMQWGVPLVTDEGISVLKIFHPAAMIYQRSRIDEQKELLDKNRHLWE